MRHRGASEVGDGVTAQIGATATGCVIELSIGCVGGVAGFFQFGLQRVEFAFGLIDLGLDDEHGVVVGEAPGGVGNGADIGDRAGGVGGDLDFRVG